MEMINLVEDNFKEREFIEGENFKILHIFNRFTSFYVKYEDIVVKNYYELCNNDNINCGGGINYFDINKPNYNGKLQTQKLLNHFKKLGLQSDAIDYCILKGGYLGTREQINLFKNKINIDVGTWSSSVCIGYKIYPYFIKDNENKWFTVKYLTYKYHVIPLYDKPC